MSPRSPSGVARFDSAAAMARALGACLRGSDVESPSAPALLDQAMPAINLLPRRAREWVYSLGGMAEAIGETRVRSLDLAGIARWLAGLYPRRSYPAAFIGSSNGALMHLAAALGIPWLPQTFLCPIRALGNDPDDARAGFASGRRIVESLLDAHPGIAVHQMHDPNRDRLMLRTMSYFRIKHRVLPAAYREFLVHNLPAGATLYVCECTGTWPVTRTSARSVFQFGAVGGCTIDEYFRGSRRVREYLARYGVPREKWDPPEPNGMAPEAEWGFDPALLEDLATLADARGWRLLRLRFEHPEAMSWLAAAVYRAWYGDLGIRPQRLVVDSFVLLDPHRTLRLRAVPFWLCCRTRPSAAELRAFLEREATFDEVDLMLFSHGTEEVGLACIGEWRRLLARARRRGRFIGVDERRYPHDFATLNRFRKELAQLGLPFGLPPPLPLARFEAFVRREAPSFAVELVGADRAGSANVPLFFAEAHKRPANRRRPFNS
jgi:hypothetical protein